MFSLVLVEEKWLRKTLMDCQMWKASLIGIKFIFVKKDIFLIFIFKSCGPGLDLKKFLKKLSSISWIRMKLCLVNILAFKYLVQYSPFVIIPLLIWSSLYFYWLGKKFLYYYDLDFITTWTNSWFLQSSCNLPILFFANLRLFLD